jgi:cytidylate kinase
MSIFQNIINHKLNTMTADELLQYADQYQISLSRKEASQIANYVKGKKVNIFNDEERSQLIRELAKITNIRTAKEVNRLLSSFTK